MIGSVDIFVCVIYVVLYTYAYMNTKSSYEVVNTKVHIFVCPLKIMYSSTSYKKHILRKHIFFYNLLNFNLSASLNPHPHPLSHIFCSTTPTLLLSFWTNISPPVSPFCFAFIFLLS